ncbi:hypothetical protein D7Y05_02830 [bacterium 1XD42-54]|nr:hypothetical protein D7Y05_02830 [bacterium 1XD42-54]
MILQTSGIFIGCFEVFQYTRKAAKLCFIRSDIRWNKMRKIASAQWLFFIHRLLTAFTGNTKVCVNSNHLKTFQAK